MDYQECLDFATRMHEGQTRKLGQPYIEHPIRVSQAVAQYGILYQVTGLFHDLLEDTRATEKEILSLSNDKVLEAVRLLSKGTDYNVRDYLDKILENPIAKAVKNADRIDNLQSSHELLDCNISFVRKYLKDTENYLGRFSIELDKEYDILRVAFEAKVHS